MGDRQTTSVHARVNPTSASVASSAAGATALNTSPGSTRAHLAALTANLRTFGLRVWRYIQYRGSPILHRKEAFLAAEHPLGAKVARLTRLEDAMGLYAAVSRIGTRDGWQAVLDAK